MSEAEANVEQVDQDTTANDETANDTPTFKHAKAGVTYRPEQIANAVGLSGKIVRSYLRATFTRPIEAKNSSWVLTDEQTEQTVAHFLAKRATNANEETPITTN